jgi:hypothetical protein
LRLSSGVGRGVSNKNVRYFSTWGKRAGLDEGEDNLEIAKLEALRFAANDDGNYFVFDLGICKIVYETERVTRPPRWIFHH